MLLDTWWRDSDTTPFCPPPTKLSEVSKCTIYTYYDTEGGGLLQLSPPCRSAWQFAHRTTHFAISATKRFRDTERCIFPIENSLSRKWWKCITYEGHENPQSSHGRALASRTSRTCSSWFRFCEHRGEQHRVSLLHAVNSKSQITQNRCSDGFFR